LYNLDAVGPMRGMVAAANDGPMGYAIIRSKAPRFGRRFQEALDVAYDPDTTAVAGSSSLAQAVDRSPRAYSNLSSRVSRFEARPAAHSEGAGPGERGVPRLPDEMHVRAATFGATPRFEEPGRPPRAAANDALELDLECRGPTAGLTVSAARSSRNYSVLRSTSPRFKAPPRPPGSSTARGRMRGGAGAVAVETKDGSLSARDGESLTAREARTAARDYGHVFRSRQGRFRAPAGDRYLRNRLEAMAGPGDSDSLASRVARSPRRVGTLTSTAPRFPGASRVDTGAGPGTAVLVPGESTRVRKVQGPGPGSYDVERGLRATMKGHTGTAPVSRAPRFGKGAPRLRGARGKDTAVLSSRWSAATEAKQWTARGMHVDRRGREAPVMSSRGVGGCGPDVMYSYEKAPQKRGLADAVAAGHPTGGAASALALSARGARFSDPLAVRAGLPGLNVTAGARAADGTGAGGTDFYSPKVDSAGRQITIHGAAERARAGGMTSTLRSGVPRLRLGAVGEGADVAYDVAMHRSIAQETVTTLKGRSAMRRRGREEPVFRRDAAAMGWSTSAQDAAGVDQALVGGLTRLRTKRTPMAGGGAMPRPRLP